MGHGAGGRRTALLWLILGVSFCMLFLQGTNPGTQPVCTTGYVVVYVGDEIYAKVPLGQEQTLRIEQEHGEVNQVVVTPTGVHMGYASCPHQDCIQQGEVTLDNRNWRALGSWIICLPNRVSVELVGEEPS